MNIPRDIFNLIASRLDYSDTLNFCKSSKSFRNYCDGTELWKFKLARQFPEGLRIPGENPERTFLRLSVNYLENVDRIHFTPQQAELFKEIDTLLDLVNDVDEEIKKLQLKRNGIQEQINILKTAQKDANEYAYVKIKGDKLNLMRYIRNEFPSFYEINLGENFYKFSGSHAVGNINKAIEILGKGIHPGDFIVITHSFGNQDKLYNFLRGFVYVYNKDDKVLIDYVPETDDRLPKKLMERIRKRKWTFSDLVDYYMIPQKWINSIKSRFDASEKEISKNGDS